MNNLLTDTVMEDLADDLSITFMKLQRTGSHRDYARKVIDVVARTFVRHHESERKCERCEDGVTTAEYDPLNEGLTCATCHGTGRVRERKLITIGPEDDEKIAAVISDQTGIVIERATGIARSIREALTR